MRRPFFTILALVITALATAPIAAQQVELPYWASIDTPEANMRRGPGEQFPIAWVYQREGLPVKVIRMHQGWRFVVEPDGTTGWISASLLSRNRGAIVVGEGLAAMRDEPSSAGDVRWNLEPGVVGALGDCEDGWCAFDVDGHTGFVEEIRLWGAGEP